VPFDVLRDRLQAVGLVNRAVGRHDKVIGNAWLLGRVHVIFGQPLGRDRRAGGGMMNDDPPDAVDLPLGITLGGVHG